jgi:hypothetical protein
MLGDVNAISELPSPVSPPWLAALRYAASAASSHFSPPRPLWTIPFSPGVYFLKLFTDSGNKLIKLEKR